MARCKLETCKIKIEKGQEIYDNISVFCCKNHRLEYNRSQVRKVKDKVKVKKEGLYNKLSIQIQGLDEDKREGLREDINTILPKYIGAKQVIIKVKRRKLKSERMTLKDKLDNIFSHYIRARDKSCIVCGSKQNLQNGHFFTRVATATRFDETNCNTQCASCNCLHENNTEPYRRKMIEKYGEQKLEELAKIHYGPPLILKKADYIDLILHYTTELSTLESNK